MFVYNLEMTPVYEGGEGKQVRAPTPRHLLSLPLVSDPKTTFSVSDWSWVSGEGSDSQRVVLRKERPGFSHCGSGNDREGGEVPRDDLGPSRPFRNSHRDPLFNTSLDSEREGRRDGEPCPPTSTAPVAGYPVCTFHSTHLWCVTPTPSPGVE